MKSLRVAVWSLGDHAKRNVLPAIYESKLSCVAGVYTRNRVVREQVGLEYQCKVFDSHVQLLQDKSIQMVYITSPNALHFDSIVACLKHGKHVIVEKTAFSNSAQAIKAIELARENKLFIFEAFMYRFHNQFRLLQRIVKSQKYGRILFLESSFGFPHLKKDNIRYKKVLGGGALSDAGAYTISSVLNLLRGKVDLVFSKVNFQEGLEVDTSGIAVLENDTCTATCKWVFGASYKNRIEAWCEDGHLIVDRAFSKPLDYVSNIQVINNGVVVEEINCGAENHFVKMIDSFCSKIHAKDGYSELELMLSQNLLLERILEASRK